MIDMSIEPLGPFPIQRFVFVLSFSDLLIWKKLQKEFSTVLPSTSTPCGLAHSQFMWNIVCQKVGTQSIESVKLKFFLYFSRYDFLQIDVLYSIIEQFCKKNLFFSFLHLVLVFPYWNFPLISPDSSLSLEERNETLKTPN